MPDKPRFFLVSGAPDSGNRILVSIFARAGCLGEGSTKRIPVAEQVKTGKDIVNLEHCDGQFNQDNWAQYAQTGKDAGYEVISILIVRDWFCTSKGMVKNKHFKGQAEADQHQETHYRQFFALCEKHDVQFFVVTYESIVQRPVSAVRKILDRFGLRTDNLTEPLRWDGNEAEGILDANAKWLGAGQESRVAFSSQLTWWPTDGLGHFPCHRVANPKDVYGQKYFEKYEGYQATEMGRQLTEARIDLVRIHSESEKIVDIGIGSGHFIEMANNDRQSGVGLKFNVRGYDISDVGVGWLKAKGLFADPYVAAPESITCWDSLEHIPNAGALIERVRSTVFVSIPVFASGEHVVGSRHFRRDEHFWYFTEAGLVGWFDRLGFDMIDSNRMEEKLGREGIGTFVFRRR